jgi:outer membrane murein-binding lipoprotein Lpp
MPPATTEFSAGAIGTAIAAAAAFAAGCIGWGTMRTKVNQTKTDVEQIRTEGAKFRQEVRAEFKETRILLGDLRSAVDRAAILNQKGHQ